MSIIPTPEPIASMCDAIRLHGIPEREILCAVPVYGSDGFVRVRLALVNPDGFAYVCAIDAGRGNVHDFHGSMSVVDAVASVLESAGFPVVAAS